MFPRTPAVAPATARSISRSERIALAVFYAFTIASVAGYAVFGLHPELLARTPSAIAVYSVAFTFFPRAHVVLGFATLAFLLVRRAGFRWLPAFAACYALSLGSELAGTTVGLPFGAYSYGPGLGPKWFGHVPVLIPLSWFFMALPSYLLARGALPEWARTTPRGRATVILTASLVLLAWDLALDPAMSWITQYWTWGEVGPYYGMPLLNLFGWYVTGLVLMGALALLGADSWGESVPRRWLLGYYGANLLLPVGMIAAAGMWWGVTVSALAVGASLWLPRLHDRVFAEVEPVIQEAA